MDVPEQNPETRTARYVLALRYQTGAVTRSCYSTPPSSPLRALAVHFHATAASLSRCNSAAPGDPRSTLILAARAQVRLLVVTNSEAVLESRVRHIVVPFAGVGSRRRLAIGARITAVATSSTFSPTMADAAVVATTTRAVAVATCTSATPTGAIPDAAALPVSAVTALLFLPRRFRFYTAVLASRFLPAVAAAAAIPLDVSRWVGARKGTVGLPLANVQHGPQPPAWHETLLFKDVETLVQVVALRDPILRQVVPEGNPRDLHEVVAFAQNSVAHVSCDSQLYR